MNERYFVKMKLDGLWLHVMETDSVDYAKDCASILKRRNPVRNYIVVNEDGEVFYEV